MNLEEYLNHNYSRTTTRFYLREIEAMKGNLPNAKNANHQELIQYIGALRERYPNPKTINRIVCSMKAYYQYLTYINYREDNPAKSIILKDTQNRDIQLQDLFSTEELESLLNQPNRYEHLKDRNLVLMSLLIYQALTPVELEKLTIENINLEKGSIYIKSTPNTNSRELQLKPNQIILFHRYLTDSRLKLLKDEKVENLILSSRGNPMLAEDLSKYVIRTFKGVFPERKISPITIRQSVIANLLKSGHDLRVVQVFAGHKKPSSTEQYKQARVEELKNQIERFHPMR